MKTITKFLEKSNLILIFLIFSVLISLLFIGTMSITAAVGKDLQEFIPYSIFVGMSISGILTAMVQFNRWNIVFWDKATKFKAEIEKADTVEMLGNIAILLNHDLVPKAFGAPHFYEVRLLRETIKTKVDMLTPKSENFEVLASFILRIENLLEQEYTISEIVEELKKEYSGTENIKNI